MNHRKILGFLLPFTLGLALGTPADAGGVLFDDFDSAGATVGDDLSDPTDIAWTGSSSPVTQANISIGNKSFSSPRALYNQGGGTYRYATGAIPALQSLTKPGQTLVLDLQFRTNNANGNNSNDTSNGYQMGLFAPNGTGYFMNIAAGNNASDLSWKKDTGPDIHLAGASDNVTLSSYGAGAPTISDDDYDKIRLTFVRTIDGMSMAAEYADDQAATPVTLTAGDTSIPVTSFDRIAVGLGDHGIDYWIDDVGLQSNDGSNYIPNGDFEQGNTGFDSNYTFSGSHGGGGSYGIVDNPNDWFGAMSVFGDHTTGSGLMLVGDGGPVTDNMVLGWTIPVVEGLPYNFVGYFAEAGGGTTVSQQEFEIRLDGVPLTSIDLAGFSPGDWQELSYQFVAPSTNPLARLTIHALRTGGGGNNFVIDDIRFGVVPEPATLVVWSLLAGLALGTARRRRSR